MRNQNEPRLSLRPPCSFCEVGDRGIYETHEGCGTGRKRYGFWSGRQMTFLLAASFLGLCFLSRGCEGKELRYVWGDALSDRNALGPDGTPYPWEETRKFVGRQGRTPRSLEREPLLSPEETRNMLLQAFEAAEASSGFMEGKRSGRSSESDSSQTSTTPGSAASDSGSCGSPGVPTRLCETNYNTTAPLYGISLTSGKPVTIVQKFPDLLQQVVYQVCKSEECDLIQGRCVQTYLPYLFLVIPLGPVTLTGQDYVLVESGCACKPKYSKKTEDQPVLPFIQHFNATNPSPLQTKPRTNKRF